MRRAEKKEVLNFINSFYQAHEEIKEALSQNKMMSVQNMLSECQEFAIQLGETIEKLEGEGHTTVAYVEEYCETLFCVFETIRKGDITTNAKVTYKHLNKLLVRIENSAKNDITVKKEIAFFPYKASMWDSLESVYLAAKEDPNCDAYCIPIPYFDVKPDRTLGQMHYEGHDYPEGIEVIDWQTYNFEERKPDVIYIHNPYDNWNLVTSVHPRFYSENLKRYTDTLVYIPYYSTTGGMSEGQKLCPAYIYADYIVIQAPGFRKYFDERIPDEKFLPFGSPKFDKIIRKCQNPPEPPADWKKKMEGRKVYFYNTSIGGMLSETEDFLKKIKYIFSCFEGREDACLLWRPHPLLESTFDSMRPMYREEYLTLKREFLDKELGIYDDTPDMEDTIALCDAYIGDAGTSVTSLFGIVGKPMFILNNKLHSEPDENSWRGEVYPGFNYTEGNRFSITQGNRLYVSQPFAHDYKYLCDLADYVYGGDYNIVDEVDQKLYVCPQNAQNILVIDELGEKKKIALERVESVTCNFFCALNCGNYLILLPYGYPAIVRYDVTDDTIKYFRDDIDVFVKEVNGTLKFGGLGGKNGKLYLTSPTDNRVYMFDIETGKHQIVEIPIKSECGYRIIIPHIDGFWLLPYEGDLLHIVRWNPDTNEVEKYDEFPQGFQCLDPMSGDEHVERAFSSGILCGECLYLTPDYANMYICLNTKTGKMTEWKTPFDDVEGNEYFYTTTKSSFIWGWPDEKGKAMLFSYPKRKLYEICLETNNFVELKIQFDIEELKAHEPGFCRSSEQLRYCCHENAFNSIRNFLDGSTIGNQFDRESEIELYKEVISNSHGTCGEEVHAFMSKL